MAAPVTGKRRMRNGWKTLQPSRYARTMQPRQVYELTEAEYAVLGGTPEGGQLAVDHLCLLHWQDVATRLNVVLLSICWPHSSSRTISAEPRE